MKFLMETEKVKVKETKAITKMALEIFENEYLFDDEKIIFIDEEHGIKKAIEEVTPRVLEVARQFKLPRKAVAMIALAVAMSRYLSFVYLEFECRCSPSKIVKVMESLGFKRVRSKCLREILEDAVYARWNVAEEFMEAIGRDFVILRILPIYENLIFEKIE